MVKTFHLAEQASMFLETSKRVFHVVRVPEYHLDSFINPTLNMSFSNQIQAVIKFTNIANLNR